MRRQLWFIAVAGVLGLLVGCGGGGGIPIGAIQVSDNITSNAAWVPNPAIDCDYIVAANKEIEVRAALTIAAGTKVCFNSNSGLEVMETGSLNAVGTAANPIVFTGTTAAKGFWKGLAFRSNNPANQLTFASVLFAGNNDNFCCDYFQGPNISAALVVGSNASANATLGLSNSTIANSGNFGLFVFNSGHLTLFLSNRFESNTKAPVALSLIHMNSLDAASVYSGGANANTDNFIAVNEINSTSTDVNITITKLDVPYLISAGDPGNENEYRGDIIIQPGVTLQFEANSGLEIMPTGSLNAVGTATEPITFTGKVATKGYWKGLAIRSNTPANRLERAVIEFAGNNDNFCCDYFQGPNISSAILLGANSITGATLALVNSTVRNSDNYGVFQFTGNTVTASGNTYTSNDSGNNPVGLP